MTTKSDILKWYCADSEKLHACEGLDEFGRCYEWDTCFCSSRDKLSAFINDLMDGCPSEKIVEPSSTSSAMKIPHRHFVFGYNEHCDKVKKYKKEVLG